MSLEHNYINPMVMDYGDATRGNCVVVDGACDMGRSAIRAARNFHENGYCSGCSDGKGGSR